MKVLIIGSGGREHALAWRLSQSQSVTDVFVAPGNPGAAQVASCVPALSIDDQLAFALEHQIDLTVVGPEAPLVDGVVDRFRAAGLAICGPTAAAAQLEGSKAFSKEIMTRAGVRTARYVVTTSCEQALQALDQFGFPVVLKADGLAAGKGVVIAMDRREAEAAIDELTSSRLVVEEFLPGEEVSYIVITDGYRAIPFAPTQDHKTVFDGNKGPNTGGMGAYRDSGILTPEQEDRVQRTIIEPVLTRMREDGNPFTGFLYAGLMMTADGPRVLEFNVRLGDPETQPLMCGLQSDLAQVLLAAARGSLAGVAPLEWDEGSSVCVVLAAHGYPGPVRTADEITGLVEAEAEGAKVFQAGTSLDQEGRLKTSGGRVLGVTTSAANLPAAIKSVYRAAAKIQFDGLHYRTDIGARGLRLP